MVLPKRPKPCDESSDEECIVEDMGSEEEIDDDGEEMDVNEQIQVDFEGFGIVDSDFHGIRQLLHQLFPKENIDISEITNLLIGQNYIGTLLKQADIEGDESLDKDDLDQVFGVTSCVSCNGMSKPNLAISNLVQFLIKMCKTYVTDDQLKQQFCKILQAEKEESCLGWIINERFINIPPQVSLPMFEKLQMEIGEARSAKHKTCYNFTHYMMICKTCCPKVVEEGKKFVPENFEFINSEEELFAEEASLKFSYPLPGAAGILSGKWDEDSSEMQPCRTVLLLTEEKIISVIGKLKHQLELLAAH